MRRRRLLNVPVRALTTVAAVAGIAACQTSAQSSARTGAAPTGQPQDLKKVAASLQVKTGALIDAISANNTATIAKAKDDLSKEANNAEDAVKSETGATANRINSAVNYIRQGTISNNVSQLQQAKTLLEQVASQ